MRVALTQMSIEFEKKEFNQYTVEHLIKKASQEGAELIIFPEMTLTGFSMNAEELAEHQSQSKTVAFFRKMTRLYGIAICFGYIRRTEELPENVAVFMDNGRIVNEYVKIHPFSMSLEDKYYRKGNEIVHINWKGINIGLAICYDLRFPELFQMNAKENDCMIVIANWPKQRVYQWRQLLIARAIETQSYMLGVNIKGESNGLFYEESSIGVDPYGEVIAEGKEKLLFVDVVPGMARQYRTEFNVSKDRRIDLY